MTARVFVDTNLWVYAVDVDEPAKQARARAVLHPATSEHLFTSAQVLCEFYVTVTRKFDRAIAHDIADRMVQRMARLPVVPIDADRVLDAVEGVRTGDLVLGCLAGTSSRSRWPPDARLASRSGFAREADDG